MKTKNLVFKLISHLLTLATLGFVIYLYLDLFVFVVGDSPDDGYKLFHLIITVPFPIIIAIVLNAFIDREIRNDYKREVRFLLLFFPLICLVSTVGQFLLLSFTNASNLFYIVFSIILFCINVILFIYDLRHR
ncbi:hypothetical protein I6N90_14330 [Paenibacillus sp. GSMTC-2017]|uniref:hypothetical protein n=1 Tax=Paenibacillus sp. GSMTC-2017 TaxID=2794350 RepID=UPI0018D738E6|nr:hypothetical protein [Paenibacillus sp. GSMTC-2017]MBH5318979.1 hypothetical protein [Paenibacillus sp. GSMTC-2017]